MINFGVKKQAFSLMEMMVVMLVVSIILALSAPMITKKTVGAGQGHCLWTSLPGGNIGFNANQNAVSVVIGGNTSEIQSMGANTPKLTIATNSNYPHIGFLYDNKLTGTLRVGNSGAIAIGLNADASDTGTFDPGNSIAIGSNATATGRGVIAIGKGAVGNYWDSIALGSNTLALSMGSIAIGNNAQAESSESIAIGKHAHSGYGNYSYFKNNAIAIGHWANAPAGNSIAIGYIVNALQSNSIAIGLDSQAYGYGAMAIGENCSANASSSTAVGHWAHTNSDGSTALGYVTTIGNNSAGAVAIRGSVDDNSREAIAIGGFANGVRSIGLGARADGEATIAIGSNIVANSSNSIAISPNPYGTMYSIYGCSNSIAIGPATRISDSKCATAIGNNARAFGTSPMALGDSAQARASNAIAIGTNVKAAAANTIVIGHGITNSTPNVLQLGDANTTVYIPGKIEFGNITANNITVKNDLYAGGTVALNNLYYCANRSRNYFKFAVPASVHYEEDNPVMSGSIIHGTIYGNIVTANSPNFNIVIDGKKKHLTSDKRLKNILGENYDAMDKIRLLKVYDYTFKKEDLRTPHVGVMAQDLQKIFPNAVTKDENGYLQIRHEDMFYAMINALKELDAKIKQIAIQLAENIKIVTSDSEKIRDLTIRVNSQDKEIKEQNKKLLSQEKIINAQSQKLSAQDKEINALKKEITEINDLRKEIADLKKIVNKLSH